MARLGWPRLCIFDRCRDRIVRWHPAQRCVLRGCASVGNRALGRLSRFGGALVRPARARMCGVDPCCAMVGLGQCPSGAELARGGSCEVSVVSLLRSSCSKPECGPVARNASPRTTCKRMSFVEGGRASRYRGVRGMPDVAEETSRQEPDVGEVEAEVAGRNTGERRAGPLPLAGE